MVLTTPDQSAKREWGEKETLKESVVRLVSGDGIVMEVDRNLVLQSPVLAIFLDPTLGWSESQSGIVHLKGIDGRLLERIVQYLQYRFVYDAAAEDSPLFKIAPEDALDLMLIADYLEL